MDAGIAAALGAVCVALIHTVGDILIRFIHARYGVDVITNGVHQKKIEVVSKPKEETKPCPPDTNAH